MTHGEVEGTGKICEKNFPGVWFSELAINGLKKIDRANIVNSNFREETDAYFSIRIHPI